jgi:mRNA-degrading endonuclease toxin of MazEF toxin-antitoxin module
LKNNNPLTRSRYPFAVVLQHDRVPSAGTVIVAPLTATNSALASSRLHPPINLGGRSFLIMTEELAAAHRRSLGRIIASAESERYAIVAAIDLCFTGI